MSGMSAILLLLTVSCTLLHLLVSGQGTAENTNKIIETLGVLVKKTFSDISALRHDMLLGLASQGASMRTLTASVKAVQREVAEIRTLKDNTCRKECRAAKHNMTTFQSEFNERMSNLDQLLPGLNRASLALRENFRSRKQFLKNELENNQAKIEVCTQQNAKQDRRITRNENYRRRFQAQMSKFVADHKVAKRPLETSIDQYRSRGARSNFSLSSIGSSTSSPSVTTEHHHWRWTHRPRKETHTTTSMMTDKPNAVDCKDIYNKGFRQSGVYTIQPANGSSFPAYCDLAEEGWTTIFKYDNRLIYKPFDRSWKEYVNGFGGNGGDFWLGLEKLHNLTSPSSELLMDIDLEDNGLCKNNVCYAHYTIFHVGDSSTNYTLTVGGSYNSSLPYGFDYMKYHNGKQFSTNDRDNDNWLDGNCADDYDAGWWYSSCFEAGMTLNPSRLTYRSNGNTFYIRRVIMKIRTLNGWIEILRKEYRHANIFFWKSWENYKEGFGDITTTRWWLGLDKMHRLTAENSHLRLTVDLDDNSLCQGGVCNADYTNFHIGNSTTNFSLSLGIQYNTTLPHNYNYLQSSDGRPFTAGNHDNDNWSGGSCGKYYCFGWWYDVCSDIVLGCSKDRLYYRSGDKKITLRSITMKIRH